MTKRNNDTRSSSDAINDPFAATRAALAATPEGFVTQSDDVVGYWDPTECPILCIPRTAKLFDGSIEKIKPSTLIIAELAAPCIIALKKDEGAEEGEKIVGKKGDMVGIWGKPGMRSIRDLCGVVVKITLTGEKDTGKPNPMKVFKVESATKGTRIPVTEDTRKESKNAKTMFDGANVVQGGASVDMTDSEFDAGIL